MIAVRNYFPNGCMAPNGCADPQCYLCGTVTELPQPQHASDLRRADTGTRDGVADTKGGESLAFKKRNRVGPHR